MELEQAMENRRSIRKYEAKPVETEKIRKMIQAAGPVSYTHLQSCGSFLSYRTLSGREQNPV